ncbi:MAG: sulfatase [Kiritimatiellia bacterium]
MVQRPNVVVFCVDEQRGDHLGCMGHPHVQTPNLDRLAAEGTLFRNCFSSSPVCMPARATMLTGLTNRTTGVYTNGINLDESIPTLPGILAAAGYRTHAAGKLHHKIWGGRTIAPDEDTSVNPERRIYWDWPGHWQGEHYKEFPDNYYGYQTLDICNGHVNYAYGDYVTWLEKEHPGAYAGYKYSNREPKALTIEPDLHYNHWIADRTIDFIREQVAGGKEVASCRLQVEGGSDKPFYVWCSFPDPHEPFAAVEKWADVYKDLEIVLPEHTRTLSPENRCEALRQLGLGQAPFDPDWTRECIRQTYGMISHIDEQIGRVLAVLDETGIADNTVVMFISDHGDQLGEHGLFYKGMFPFNAHAHIPFIAKVPGCRIAGNVIEDVVSQLDLVPTVLDLAGVSHPDDLVRQAKSDEPDAELDPALPGEVLTPVLVHGQRPARRNALIELDWVKGPFRTLQMRTLVKNDYKLAYYAPTQETMLFDRQKDPDERRNVADDPAYAGVVTAMLKELLAELARTEHRACAQNTSA